MELTKAIELLHEYAELEDNELGEGWISLIEISNKEDYGLSREFICAVEKEIIEQAEYIKEHAKIVSKPKTIKYNEREVVWDNE